MNIELIETNEDYATVDRDSDLEAWEHSRLIVHLATFKSMMKIGEKDFPEMWALYSFYYAKARKDNTNQPWAVDKYCMKGLGWGKDKFYRIKKLLLENKFIEQIRDQDETTKQFSKFYIKVNYMCRTKSQCPENKDNGQEKASVPVSPLVANQVTNALSVSQDEVLKVTSKDVAVEVQTSQNNLITFTWPEVQKLAVEMNQTKEFVKNRIELAIERMENLPEPCTNPKGWIIGAVKGGWGDTAEDEDRASISRNRQEARQTARGFEKARQRTGDSPEAQEFYNMGKQIGETKKELVTSRAEGG